MTGTTRARRAVLAGALLVLGVLSPGSLAQRQHVVAAGDTLFSLAARYDTSVEALRGANSLDGDLLRIGQLLELPGGPGFRVERSREGESLADLARRFRLLDRTLRLANPELDGAAPLATATPVLVPPSDGLPLRLRAGVSLLELALGHGVSPAELLAMNGLASLTEAVEGDWLLLPIPQAVGGPDASSVDPVSAFRTSTSPGDTVGRTAEVDGAASVPTVSGASGPRHSAVSGGADWHASRQAELLRVAPTLLAGFRPMSEEFIVPLSGRLSSGFGWRNISVGGNRFHGGIDLAVDSGTPVAAARDGIVARTGWVGAYGYAVYLDHDESLQTRYAHLSRVLVVPGEIVRQGDVIALAGSTGASTGPHLHFEIRIGGVAVDPLSLLR